MLGPKGILHSVVTGFVAGYRPTLTLTTSKSAKDEIKKKLDGKLKLSVGPLSFGKGSLSGSGSTETSNLKEDKESIEIKSESDCPQILGVIVANPMDM